MHYADHVEQHGAACVQDGSGRLAKHTFGPYVTEPERTTWFKIKNRSYSQMQGREELFERERHKEPVAGWHCCELAYAEIEQDVATIATDVRHG